MFLCDRLAWFRPLDHRPSLFNLLLRLTEIHTALYETYGTDLYGSHSVVSTTKQTKLIASNTTQLYLKRVATLNVCYMFRTFLRTYCEKEVKYVTKLFQD